MLNAPQSLGMLDHFDKTELKIRDREIKKLQAQVRNNKQTEQDLKTKMKTVKINDELLIDKLSDSICFGKVVIHDVYKSSFAYKIDYCDHLMEHFRDVAKQQSIATDKQDNSKESSYLHYNPHDAQK